MYLLKLALRPWRLAPLSQILAGTAVGFLLFLTGFVFWMEQGLKPVINRLAHEQVITAYLDPSISNKDQTQVLDTLRTSLGAHSVEVDEGSAQKFIQKLDQHYPALARELDELGSEAQSIIPRYVSISGMMPSEALDQVRAIKGVESAESSRDHYHYMLGAFSALRWVAKLMTVGLVLALLTGIFQLARMNSHLHREALSLMKQWGAGEWTLRAPSALGGLAVGSWGGLFAFLVWTALGSSLADKIRVLSPVLRDVGAPGFKMGLLLLLCGMVAGFLSGTLGAQLQPQNNR